MGGPGAGKTCELLRRVGLEAEEHGTRIGDLSFVSFARSQTEDVKRRIRSVYREASLEDIKTSVATVHAMGLRSCKEAGLLDLEAEIIVEGTRTGKYFTEFAAAHHLPYKPELARLAAPDDERAFRGSTCPPGNALFRIARYIVGQYTWGPEQADNALAATGTHIPSSYGDRVELLRAWAEFKAERGLYEHDDYIRLAIDQDAPPPARVLVVDEFQDLSPLQFVLFESWRQSGGVDRVYVAGDPHQSIYGFRGADPVFLENIRAPVQDIGATADQRPLSRRCPAAIVEVADRVLGKRSNMAPRGPGGLVEVREGTEFAGVVEALHRRYGLVMVLARYQRDTRRLSKALSAAGFPHSALHPDRPTVWQRARTVGGADVNLSMVLAILDAIEAYEQTGYPLSLDPSRARAFADVGHLRVKPQIVRRDIANRQSVYLSDVIGWFGLPPRPGAARTIAAGGLDLREDLGRGLLAAFDRGPNRPDRSAIVVDTIHAAKGRQAPAVVLHTGYQKTRAREYWQNPAAAAEENRVYYVGITRASEHLVILDGLRSGPSAPPLRVVRGVRQ